MPTPRAVSSLSVISTLLISDITIGVHRSLLKVQNLYGVIKFNLSVTKTLIP
jgi:hypothetical protein